MFLLVGLGNPGPEYEMTRHNVGFLFIDAIASESSGSSFQNKFHSLTTKVNWNGHDLVLLKPQTFMNLSGKAVQECLAFFKIKPERLIVVFDDLDQETGAVRARFGGGHGGHNGVRDILARLGTDQFHRLKVGIGKPQFKGAGADWVLGKIRADEERTINESFNVVRERLLGILKQEAKKPG
jgi:PTH1 family peptidyl-tRNA hydrolase